jgi:nitroreductase/NAD-dependent dihydropyrimidine dehydrogenase PreA subunit
MINIDYDKCNDCAICYDVCPSYVLAQNDQDNAKKVAVRYPDLCTFCGHCVAACPKGAIVHEGLSSEDFLKLSLPAIKPTEMKNLLFSRRSTRCFTADPVPDDVVPQLIDVAIHSGTASNLQTEGFHIIKDQAFLRKFEELVINILWDGGLKFFSNNSLIGKILTKVYGPEISSSYRKYHRAIKRRRENGELEGMIFRNAPLVIIVHGLKKNFHAHANCAIAVRNMELLAITMGLATCWVGFLTSAAHMNRKKINRFLELNESRQIYGALMIGSPKYKYQYHKLPRKKRDVKYE